MNMQPIYATIILLIFTTELHAQQVNNMDTTIVVNKNTITLSEVVINNKLNVPTFIQLVKNDTSFYKAFRNLHILNFSAINDIRMLDKNGNNTATLHSTTHQKIQNNCRSMQVQNEVITGDYFTAKKELNYYTAQMYTALFFTNGIVCNEDNIVLGKAINTAGKTGLEKHKQQLKMLFFNPGKRIDGLPFMANKTAIYDDEMASLYSMSIDMEMYNKTSCYVFRQKVIPGNEADVVVDEMTTWFNDSTYEVVARNYQLSYDATFYDFKVLMEVEMTHANGLLVPALIRYNGNWKAIFKKREKGIFTATLFDFK